MTARSEIGEWRWRPVSLENNQRLQVDAGGGVASEDEEENNSQLWLYFLSEPSRGHHSLILVFDVTLTCRLWSWRLQITLHDLLLRDGFMLYTVIIICAHAFELMTRLKSLLEKACDFCLGSQRSQLLHTVDCCFISATSADRTF